MTCLFVCLFVAVFDAPRPVVLCRTSKPGGALPVGYLARRLDGAREPLSRRRLTLRWILAGSTRGRMQTPPGPRRDARVGLPSSPGPPVAGYRASPPTGPLTAPQEGAVKEPGNLGSG